MNKIRLLITGNKLKELLNVPSCFEIMDIKILDQYNDVITIVIGTNDKIIDLFLPSSEFAPLYNITVNEIDKLSKKEDKK